MPLWLPGENTNDGKDGADREIKTTRDQHYGRAAGEHGENRRLREHGEERINRPEWGRDEFARGGIPAVEGVDQSMTLKPVDGHLIW